MERLLKVRALAQLRAAGASRRVLGRSRRSSARRVVAFAVLTPLLMVSLVAGRLVAGTTSVDPANGATGVPVTIAITITFEREMDVVSLMTGISVERTESGAEVVGQVVQDPDDATVVRFRPLDYLELATDYTLTILGTVEDTSGTPLGSDFTSTFTTSSEPPSPHVEFTSESSACKLCHTTHGAASPGAFGGPLLRSDRELGTCYACHDGSPAKTDVEAEFASASSGHKLEDSLVVPGEGMTAVCSSCHAPHFDAATRDGLYPTTLNGFPVTGNNSTWCEACHDDEDSWAFAGYPYPAGGVASWRPFRDETGYPILGTFPGSQAYNDVQSNPHNPTTSQNVVWPGSGRLSGDCRNCHLSHGGPGRYDALVADFRPTPDATSTASDRADGTYAELCFTCHDSDGPATKDVKRFTSHDASRTGDLYTGGHRIMTAGGLLPEGAPLPCYDCHNPHGSKGNDGTNPNKALVSDEQWSGIDTSTTTGVVDFCMKCHLPWEFAQGSGRPEQGTVPPGQLTHIEGLDRTAAANKLSLIEGIVAHGRANMESPTRSCYDCHMRDYAAPTATDGYNVHRPDPGRGGCVDCHSQPRGSRPAVVGEFAGTSHHVVGGAVSDADCGVCHMERDAATGRMAPGYHADGDLDLRSPDSGGALSPIASLVRDRAVNGKVLEPEVVAVQYGLCLACHDADGARSADARVEGATAKRPFSANTRDVPNIWDAVDPANAFDHAVRSPGDNPYATATPTNGEVTTMVAPWNQGGTHDLVSCFDCHVTSAGHGGSNAYMGLTDLATAAGQRDLCVSCHDSRVYIDGQDGSRFTDHGKDDHQLGGDNPEACRSCHAGRTNRSSLGANGSPGDIHGGSYTWSEGDSAGSAAAHFMYGGYLSGWIPGTCWAGSCHADQGY